MKRSFVINWFVEHSTLTKEELEENNDINYLEQGWIDSFAFLELLSSCEEQLEIRFSDEDFDNDDFFTIEGFISALERK